VSGRYYAMDRDKRWDRVEKAYRAIVEAEGPHFPDAPAVIADAYANKKFDEFVVPAVVGDYRGMKDGDGVLCFNFRADRVREILGAMLDPNFSGFARQRVVRFAAAVGMAQYSAELNKLMQTIFPPQSFEHILGEVAADAGRKQLRMAETEKYAHVTYFFNGGIEKPFAGEDRVLVASQKVATYDLAPEMSAEGIADAVVKATGDTAFDIIIVNFANADMVGHSGKLEPTIRAVETVDRELGRIYQAIKQRGGALLVTADHGNAEMLIDPITGGPHTAHTTNPVPFILITDAPTGTVSLSAGGSLRDISPTILSLLHLDKPKEMTGGNLRVVVPAVAPV
jgi:2,3-bisphosphoglycerate-independent phosphoglycerate mutase